jgi:DNA polymerase I-like protein with 3'-5' exonuclease and polymerase domains
MRNFIEANEGFALAQGDFSSEEFAIAAIMSQDKKMMEAYQSGDVYLAFAKAARLVPSSATKSSHKKMRDVCKTLVLSISYNISARGLAPRLTQSSGEEFTEAQAQALIDKFYETCSDYKEWKESILEQYEGNAKLFLSDGWVMWGDNRNSRSVGNYPVQGEGSTIMRHAVALAQDAGLNVLLTVHDSLMIEFKSGDIGAVALLRDCMVQAFEEVMTKFGKTIPVRVDLEAWSKDYATAAPELKGCTFAAENISEKGKLDLERYRKFFQ